MTRFRAPKKASTLAIDKGRVARHIKPLIGRFQVAAVTRDDIEDLLHDVTAGKTAATEKTKPRGLARVRGGRGTANRVVRLLGGIFSYAVKKKMRADNPVRGVTQHKDGERERRLNAEEYRALGAALRKAETQNPWPAVIAVIRFLALTGWRSGEALALRWDEIDLSRRTAFLPDTKTGKSARPLSEAACDVLRSLPYQKTGLVFPATRGDGDTTMSGFKRQFRNIIKAGGLSLEITPHILRHSFASTAADLGYSDLTIGALIGHKGRSMTSRYAHGADPVLLAACDGVANHVLKQMGVTATPARKLPRKGERQAA
jgi:integrase